MIFIHYKRFLDTQYKDRLVRALLVYIPAGIFVMHYLGVFTALTALSGLAVALPRPNPPKQVPIKYDALHEIRSLNTNTGSVTRRAIESGAKILKPIKVHPSFTKRSDGEHKDSIDFSRLDLGKQAQLVYGSPDCTSHLHNLL